MESFREYLKEANSPPSLIDKYKKSMGMDPDDELVDGEEEMIQAVSMLYSGGAAEEDIAKVFQAALEIIGQTGVSHP